MEKSGFLLAEEALKIVIALICIFFLIYFLIALYFNNSNAQNLQEANSVLLKSSNSMSVVINSLSDGKYQNFVIDNPSGWYLFSFVGNQKPNSCSGTSCICLCSQVCTNSICNLLSNVANRQINECSNKGVCLSVSNLQGFDPIKINTPKEGLTTIMIKNSGGTISIQNS